MPVLWLPIWGPIMTTYCHKFSGPNFPVRSGERSFEAMALRVVVVIDGTLVLTLKSPLCFWI